MTLGRVAIVARVSAVTAQRPEAPELADRLAKLEEAIRSWGGGPADLEEVPLR